MGFPTPAQKTSLRPSPRQKGRERVVGVLTSFKLAGKEGLVSMVCFRGEKAEKQEYRKFWGCEVWHHSICVTVFGVFSVLQQGQCCIVWHSSPWVQPASTLQEVVTAWTLALRWKRELCEQGRLRLWTGWKQMKSQELKGIAELSKGCSGPGF